MADFLASFFRGFKVPHKLYWDGAEEKIIETQLYLNGLRTEIWLQSTVGRWYWWFMVFWTIFPLFIWWKYTDRNRFLEISFFGLMTCVSAGTLDTAGVSLGLWVYPFKILPFLPAFFPIDFVIIPVVFMLLYQRYASWKQFLITSTTVAALLSMVFDPIMVWMNIYQPLKWQYYYSIPVFVLMVSFCRLVTILITRQDTGYGRWHYGK